MHNFDVYDAATDRHHFYLYSEWDGSSGPDEVLSMLMHHLSSPLMTRTMGSGILVIWADNCGGQNKNQYIVALLNELSNPASPFHKFRRVDLRFPVPGHNFLVCDRAFSVLERFAGGKTVYVPSEMAHVVKKAFASRQHAEMFPRIHFKNWKQCLETKYSVLNKTVLGGEPGEQIRFNDVMWFNFGECGNMLHPDELWFKYSLRDSEPWKKINIRKRGSMLLPDNHHDNHLYDAFAYISFKLLCRLFHVAGVKNFVRKSSETQRHQDGRVVFVSSVYSRRIPPVLPAS